MAILRPAITGDVVQDSWADQVTRAINNGTLGAVGGGGIGGGSGTGPAGIDGFNAATIYLFRRNDSALPPADITIETVYDYETGVLTGGGNTGDPDLPDDDIDGWYRAIPDTTDGEYIFTIVVNVADQGESETIAPENWSTVTLLSRPGDSASVVIIQAFAEDPSLNQDVSWEPPFMGISQVSPNFKNDSAMVIGLIPTIYEGGGEVPADIHSAAAYQWSKNGEDFTQTVPVQDGTGGTSRVLLINEEDIREGNFNEVFNISVDY